MSVEQQEGAEASEHPYGLMTQGNARVSASTWMVVVLAGTALGTLAFISDELPYVAREFSAYLVGGGFTWGLGAMIVGYCLHQRRRAMASAVALLLVATLTYYGLILFVSRRWSGGTLDDGSSADSQGLASLGRALVFWLLVSLAAGILMGLLGWFARHGTARARSVAAGVAFGLLAGQGIYFLAITTPFWDPAVHERMYARLAAVFFAACLIILLSFASTLTMTLLRRNGRSLPLYALSAIATAGPCVLLWTLVERLH